MKKSAYQKKKIARLIRQLSDPFPNNRVSAIQALGRMKVSVDEAVPNLIQLLSDPYYMEVRDVAAQLLQKMGAATEQLAAYQVRKARHLIRFLSEKSESRECELAKQALREMGTSAIPALIDGLANIDYGVLINSYDILVQIGEPAIPDLVDALSYYDIAQHAADVLGQIGEPAVPALMQAIHNPHHEEGVSVKAYIAQIFAEIGEAAREAVPVLIQFLDHDYHQVRLSAVHALGNIGKAAKEAAPALRNFLLSHDEWFKLSTASALGHIGEYLEEAIPVLIQALSEKDHMVRMFAVQGFCRLHGIEEATQETLAALVQVLTHDENHQIRMFAAEALGKAGKSSHGVLPALIQSITDEDSYIKVRFLWALGKLGDAAQEAVPAIVENLSDSHFPFREASAWALFNIGSHPPLVIPALLSLLETETNERVIAAAKIALLRLGHKTPALQEIIPTAWQNFHQNVWDSLDELQNLAEALTQHFLRVQESTNMAEHPDEVERWRQALQEPMQETVKALQNIDRKTLTQTRTQQRNRTLAMIARLQHTLFAEPIALLQEYIEDTLFTEE